MPLEIERKFLAKPSVLEHCREGVAILQGYLYLDAYLTVRVRRAGGRAYLTWKGRKFGSTRLEYEVEIAPALADALLAFAGPGRRIEKTRYAVEHAGRTWDVDVFAGANAGLILAELELGSPIEPIEAPPWLDREVTNDPRFRNSKLIPMQASDERPGVAACVAYAT